jgi:hypothetical protein
MSGHVDGTSVISRVVVVQRPGWQTWKNIQVPP